MLESVSDVQMAKWARPMGREDSHEALSRGTGTRENAFMPALERVKSRGRRDIYIVQNAFSQLPD